MRSETQDEGRESANGVHSPEDVEAAVRAAARGIAERHKEYPSPDHLAEDAEFLRASNLLVAANVPLETVERLARSSTAIVAAIAHRATARRDAVSEEWLAWAIRRLTKAYAGELRFLLEAIERQGQPPFGPRVLARADDDWSWGSCLGVIAAFVDRRIRAGEAPTAADLAAV